MSHVRMAARAKILETLLASEEPAIRWKTRVLVLGEDAASKKLRVLSDEVRKSARVKALLAHRDSKGRVISGRGVYAKWQGAHWIFTHLADLGYPSDDTSLYPVREQILDCWLAPQFYEEFIAEKKSDAYCPVSAITRSASKMS